MNILLTGGSGFIGKNIIEQMPNRYNIIAPRHSELDLLDEDKVTDFFTNNKIDVVIHSATKPGHRNVKDLNNLFYSNTRMFFNLIRNSDKFNKLINLGSGAIYDMRYYQSKMTEEYFDTHVPVDDHGFCKYVCAKKMEHLNNVVDLRIFGIFGKHEDYAIRFISNAICKTLFDLPITIKQNRKFDYIYIDDLMPILDYFINYDAKQWTYNVTPDDSIDLYSIAEKVRNVAGKNLPILVGQPGLGLEYSGDNKRLREEIPDIKFTSINETIKELYEWYSNNLHLLNKEILLEDK